MRATDQTCLACRCSRCRQTTPPGRRRPPLSRTCTSVARTRLRPQQMRTGLDAVWCATPERADCSSNSAPQGSRFDEKCDWRDVSNRNPCVRPTTKIEQEGVTLVQLSHGRMDFRTTFCPRLWPTHGRHPIDILPSPPGGDPRTTPMSPATLGAPPVCNRSPGQPRQGLRPLRSKTMVRTAPMRAFARPSRQANNAEHEESCWGGARKTRERERTKARARPSASPMTRRERERQSPPLGAQCAARIDNSFKGSVGGRPTLGRSPRSPPTSICASYEFPCRRPNSPRILDVLRLVLLYWSILVHRHPPNVVKLQLPRLRQFLSQAALP